MENGGRFGAHGTVISPSTFASVIRGRPVSLLWDMWTTSTTALIPGHNKLQQVLLYCCYSRYTSAHVSTALSAHFGEERKPTEAPCARSPAWWEEPIMQRAACSQLHLKLLLSRSNQRTNVLFLGSSKLPAVRGWDSDTGVCVCVCVPWAEGLWGFAFEWKPSSTLVLLPTWAWIPLRVCMQGGNL